MKILNACAFLLILVAGCNLARGQSAIPGDTPGFYHGVASGSPLPTKMIFWTRYTPFDDNAEVEIEYRIAKIPTESSPDTTEGYAMLLDPTQNSNVRYGRAMALPENDWTVKLDIGGLTPGSEYVYSFTDGAVTTDVGRTKTPKEDGEPLEKLTFAVFSCSNYPVGYFHAYDIGSTIQSLDFWFHAGDYIYEYAGDYNLEEECTGDRCWQPLAEIISLEDYRLRYASYHLDEGLQNLRRSAPLISTWDDHETANNAGSTGAENHDPSTEGPWEDRVKAATQAYFEWLPFRPGPGPMGPVEDASLTQTFEFGDLMTFVSVDTRIDSRSLAPALADQFPAFFPAFLNTNTSEYCIEPLFSQFDTIAEGVKAEQYNPEYTMIAETKIDYIKNAFQKSNDDGKPWQVFGTATMMAKLIFPCFDELSKFVEPPIRPFVDAIIGPTLMSDAEIAGALRAICAMACTRTPFGRDDWNGYGFERAQLLKVFEENAANVVSLFGDSHDSWAFEMDADGDNKGPSIAINLGAPAVSSTGIGSILEPLFSPIVATANANGASLTMDSMQKSVDQQFVAENEYLKYANMYNKGFFTVTLTHEEAVTEFFHLDPAVLTEDFQSARELSGGLTSDFFCGTSLVSKAGEHTLNAKDCGSTQFLAERPLYWDAITASELTSSSADNTSAAEVSIFRFYFCTILVLLISLFYNATLLLKTVS